MRRLFWGIIVTIILCFCQCTPVIQAEPDKIKDIPLQTDAMTDMLSGFAAYSSFLGECRCEGIYRIPLHGSSKVQAFAYLTQFFEPALAEAVIEECTLGRIGTEPGDNTC
ncbi:hypothetical protein [Syntrophomonas palmitatica]|uniref:hypothetical protein n=1 Tax=Syntrophomonas palmitatica TaxID=402877 RepID=UPI0006D2B4ED|nr:hypothetical protein [Syntrophomonas palmitatica]